MSLDLIPYKTMPIWTETTLPEPFQKMHNTKVGTWARLTILEGALTFYELDEEGQVLAEHLFTKESDIPFVEPQAWHRVSPASDDLRCYLTFYCTPEDYFSKKYDLTRTHSEVIEAAPKFEKGPILDLGSGQGRNSLYLAKKGFDVTAFDIQTMSLAHLQQIAEEEGLAIHVEPYNIESADIPGGLYNAIISTVVLMFLNPDSIPDVIENMQSHTAPGGYNLIVAAMSTEDAPCPVNFPKTFAAGELKEYYKDWTFHKYNEDFGQLHKLDEHGNRIRMRFVTMLAQKPK